ncbi:hypothetical protein KAR91_48610 [Candidatus Pacearchaeota archaeon]|nr:hypothetical protein [Candidatus Pacearchaeota archaeon]
MALFSPGPAIADIRGSVGGTVFSKNRYGNYMRNRTVPVNPNSARQQAVRNIMGFLVNYWSQNLTVFQRASWAVYAAAVNFVNKLGNTITLTGFNQFIRSNMARQNCGLSLMDDGPVVLILPPTDADFEVAIAEGTQLVTVTFDDTQPWCSEDSAYMSIHQGVPKNSATNFYGNHFRYLGKFDGSSASPIASPQTIAVSFPVAEDQRDWCFGRIQRADGRLSVPFRDDTVVAA